MPANEEQLMFTPQRVKAILDRIKKGVPYKIAAEAEGTHYSTFHSWLVRGAEHILEGMESPYTKTLESLRKIESDRIEAATKKIRKEKKGHKGCEWELERSFWKYFGKPADVELNDRLTALEQKDGNPKQMDREESKTAGTDIKEASS